MSLIGPTSDGAVSSRRHIARVVVAARSSDAADRKTFEPIANAEQSRTTSSRCLRHSTQMPPDSAMAYAMRTTCLLTKSPGESVRT